MVTNSESFESINFFSLLGKEIDEPEIQNFLNTNQSHHKKEIGTHIYLNFFQEGISLYFTENKLTSIFFYNEGINGFKKFKGKLPYNITWEMKNKNIVEKFGDTKVKGGGNTPIWLAYNKSGIEFTFLGKFWADLENVLTHISIYVKEECNECSVCLKEIKNKYECDKKCGIVQYCSDQCKKAHINFHINYC